jgi:UDP-2,3-diacylglucosamine pyrophosphatase LpxH
MSDKQVTISVSDLHVGGGPNDPGDDHVYHKQQFSQFITMLRDSLEGQAGEIELFINGDFLEFAQVNPGAYTLGSAKFWCSEAESMQKLEPILQGHPNIFAALKEFSSQGNRVTMAAGNHDVELFWGDVQKRLQEVAGPISFALGEEWFTRYDGRLKIGHGHQVDPANCFESWWNPILAGPDGVARLEMCPGTLFMVKFVNWLEGEFPFADNIKPVTQLASILWKEDRASLRAIPSLHLERKWTTPNWPPAYARCWNTMMTLRPNSRGSIKKFARQTQPWQRCGRRSKRTPPSLLSFVR